MGGKRRQVVTALGGLLLLAAGSGCAATETTLALEVRLQTLCMQLRDQDLEVRTTAEANLRRLYPQGRYADTLVLLERLRRSLVDQPVKVSNH